MVEQFGGQSGEAAGERLGRYRILEELGRGGMGVVYRAKDTELGREVALKVLPVQLAQDPERLARIKREARTLASLSHPCIIALYNVEELDGQLVLILELAEGHTLAELIPARGYGLERFFRLAIPFIDGVATAHARGIVHRDLKPANIIVTPEGRVKILDFGLAKLRDDLSGTQGSHLTTEALTEPGTIAGTAAYMAPEQIRGGAADERSDIFAVGILLYQAATGRHPFQWKTDRPADVVTSILRDDPPSLAHVKPELPRELDRILRNCLEKDPERRFQSAKDLRNELERLEKERASTQEAPTPPVRSPRLRRPAVVAGAIALAVLALAAGFWVYRQLSPPPPPSEQVHLAVAEFRGLSGDSAPEHYRRGLVSVLGDRLAGLEGVWLVPPEGDPMPDLLVQADVGRVGQSLTLLLEVEDRPGRSTLGSEVLRGSVEAPYDLLDEAGAAIAGLLREEAGLQVRYRPRPPPTRSPEVFDAYLRARALAAGDGVGDGESALALAVRAVEEDPAFAPGWTLNGELRLARWRADRDPDTLTEAAEACRRAIRIDPERSAAHLCLARVHHAEERLLEAEEEYVRALELDPTAMEAYEGLGDIYQDLGNPDRGQRTWKRIIELHPDFWAGYWALGYLDFRSERYDAAIEQYRQALDLAPKNAKTYLSMGAAHHLLGRYEEAILAYERSLQVRPSSEAYANLGYIHLLLRRFTEAVDSYERAVDFPNVARTAYGGLGRAYFWSPDHDQVQAAEAFRKAVAKRRETLERSPNDAASWSELAYDLAMLDLREESLTALDQALRLNPDSPHYFYLAARINNRLGEHEKALDWLERAVKGGYPRAEIRLSVEFDNLRDEPKFQRLLEAS